MEKRSFFGLTVLILSFQHCCYAKLFAVFPCTKQVLEQRLPSCLGCCAWDRLKFGAFSFGIQAQEMRSIIFPSTISNHNARGKMNEGTMNSAIPWAIQELVWALPSTTRCWCMFAAGTFSAYNWVSLPCLLSNIWWWCELKKLSHIIPTRHRSDSQNGALCA